jgi:hypothetical protein
MVFDPGIDGSHFDAQHLRQLLDGKENWKVISRGFCIHTSLSPLNTSSYALAGAVMALTPSGNAGRPGIDSSAIPEIAPAPDSSVSIEWLAIVRKTVAGCESLDLDVVLSFVIIAFSPSQGLLIESVILVTQSESLFHISRNIVAYCADYS